MTTITKTQDIDADRSVSVNSYGDGTMRIYVVKILNKDGDFKRLASFELGPKRAYDLYHMLGSSLRDGIELD